jgi:hypothetical protein
MTRALVVFAMLWTLVAGASPDLHDNCKGWADSGECERVREEVLALLRGIF